MALKSIFLNPCYSDISLNYETGADNCVSFSLMCQGYSDIHPWGFYLHPNIMEVAGKSFVVLKALKVVCKLWTTWSNPDIVSGKSNTHWGVTYSMPQTHKQKINLFPLYWGDGRCLSRGWLKTLLNKTRTIEHSCKTLRVQCKICLLWFSDLLKQISFPLFSNRAPPLTS